jgi:uncharacterized protein YlxP (DUF503 family)
MFVGVLRLELSIVGARSLKDKRRVVLSAKDRLASRLRVSVAEVGELDDPRRASLGVSVVANESAHCHRVLEEVAHVAGTLSGAVLTDRATEVIAFGHGGRGVVGGIESWGMRDPSDDDDAALDDGALDDGAPEGEGDDHAER